MDAKLRSVILCDVCYCHYCRMESKQADLFWLDTIDPAKHGWIFNTENFYFNFVFNPLILEFLMGCLLAYNFRNEIVKLTLPLFLVLAGLLLISTLVYLKGFGHQLGRDGFGFVVIVSAAFLALWGSATVDKTNRFKAARLKPMLVVGDASYSIYLTHTLMIKIFYDAGFRAFQSLNIAPTKLSVNLLFLVIALLAVITGAVGTFAGLRCAFLVGC